MSDSNKKKYGLSAFLALAVFLLVYLGSGILFTALGYGSEAFQQIPRTFALVIALLVCLLMGGKERSLDYRMDAFCSGAADKDTIMMVVVFLLAGAFCGVARAMGGVDATANLGLSLVPHEFLCAGIFIISALIATAMGTGMGTISAVGPIAFAVAEGSGVSMATAMAAVLGGAMFGDNLSMISDTTIAATRGAGCEMRDKFKMNGAIAGVSAVIAIIIFVIVGSGTNTVVETYDYSIIKVVPYIFILAGALLGLNVFILLISGVVVAAVIGFATNSFTFVEMAQAVGTGMADMFEISFFALFLRGVIGVVQDLGGVDWVVHKMTRNVKSRKGAEYSMAAMVSAFDVAMENNTIAIIMAAPLCRPMAAEHNISPKRVASILDIFSCIVQGMLPYSAQVLLCASFANISPLSVVGNNFYCMILAVVTLLTIHFGLGWTKEEKNGVKLYDEDLNVIAEKVNR